MSQHTAARPSTFDKITDAFCNVHLVMHFIPLLTSFAWILYLLTGAPANWFGTTLLLIAILGVVSALLARPLRILGLLLRAAVRGVAVGLSIPIVPANLAMGPIFGAAALAGVGLMLLFAPGIYTLHCLNEE